MYLHAKCRIDDLDLERTVQSTDSNPLYPATRPAIREVLNHVCAAERQEPAGLPLPLGKNLARSRSFHPAGGRRQGGGIHLAPDHGRGASHGGASAFAGSPAAKPDRAAGQELRALADGGLGDLDGGACHGAAVPHAQRRHSALHPRAQRVEAAVRRQTGRLEDHEIRVPASMPGIRLPLSPDTEGETWDEILQRTPRLQGEPDRLLDDLATIVYPSGSTGQPKGVMQSFRSFHVCGTLMSEIFCVTPADRMLSYLPMAHVAERLAV